MAVGSSLLSHFNTHLSVIAEPDSSGLASMFQPYSFSLGGRRCFLGLPYMPNYRLGPLEATATPGDTCTWTGEYDDDWFSVCNWSTRAVPDTGNVVIIPGGTPTNPVIRNQTAYCKEVNIFFASGGHLSYDIGNGGYLVKKVW